MSDSVKESTWLLTEHLRYTPLSLVDDIINSINALLYRAVSAVEAGLLNAPATSLGFKSVAPPPPPPSSKSHHKRPETITSNPPLSSNVAEDEDPADNDDDDVNDTKNGWTPAAKLEIENGVHQLETLFEATVDKDFDKLEIYVLRNVLTVSEEIVNWMRLGHYQNLDLSPNPTAPTLESLSVLRRKLHETQKLHRALVHESRRNAALISQLNSILSPTSSSSSSSAAAAAAAVATTSQNIPIGHAGSSNDEKPPLAFLTGHPLAQSLSIGTTAAASQQQQPLTTSTEFVMTQLESLRALLRELRPKVAMLASMDALSSSSQREGHGNREDGEEQQGGERSSSVPSMQEKRTEYIESQTRRHLMDTRGLALDEKGAVRDGQWQGIGRRIGEEEVRRLEEVVEGLKKAAGGSNREQS